MPSNWLAFDRIRALTKSANVFRADKIFQDQSSLDKLTAGGEFLDFSSQSAILDQTNLQINRLERYKDYEQMDQTGEVSLALDLYADEACLAGDTHIPLLDGTCPTIAELAERGRDSEFWVYSFDQQNGKYVPALAKGARITGTNVQIVRVTLDDGSQIRCTDDHLFMLRDGSFAQACHLKSGDSLKPLYKKRRYRAKNGKALFEEKPFSTATAYEYYFNGDHFQSTHRWVYHSLNEDSPAVVHHKNFNSLDNTPTNLNGMSVAEHNAIHQKYGESNHSFKHKHELITQKICKICAVTKKSKEFLRSGCSYSPYCNECRPVVCERRYLQKSFGNHKVVSVESDGIIDKVYDIEVPKYHCFAAGTDSSWVIVHNSLVDSERKHTLIIKARNKRLKRELEDLFHNILRWDNNCRPTMRYLCKYGDAPFEIVLDQNRGGVSSLRFMNVYNFTRIETRYGDLIGFFFMDALYPKPQFLHPWQVMHLRLTSFENIYHPYGRGLLDGGRKAFKQLRLMEDAALIYRITRAPEKRKFVIPVGNIPPKEVPEYMQMIARNFKRQRFYNPTTGSFDERYSPLIQEDDFFLPRRPDGSGPDIEVMPGAENLDQIKDIEYFKKKMVAPMKIPFARVGIGDGAGEANDKSLSQSSSEFAKAVQWVQREGVNGLTKVAIVHLALRGYSVEDLKGFEIAFTANSALEELYRIETWQTRASVMNDLKDLGWFPKEWIVTHFTDLSPDEIEELKDIESEEAGGGMGGGGGIGGMGGGLGGGLDFGGEAGGDIGLDAAGAEGAAGADGAPQDAGAEAGPEAAPPEDLPEGYDNAANRRLILELKKRENTAFRKTIIERWAKRQNKELFSEDDPGFSNGYINMINSKELDGLSREQADGSNLYFDEAGRISDVYNPGDCIVEWSGDPQERFDVIRENYELLMEDAGVVYGGAEPLDITNADLPSSSKL